MITQILSKYIFSKITLNVYKNSHQRLQRFLMDQLNQDWALVQQIIRKGEVQINDKRIRENNYILNEGDQVKVWDKFKQIEIENHKRPQPSLQAYQEFVKTIIYENEEFLILNKPHGLASQGGSHTDKNIPDLLKLHTQQFYIIHRIDQSAAGILIVAKTKESAKLLSEQIQSKESTIKEYLAIVQGTPSQSQQLIQTCLNFNQNKQKTYVSQIGKTARTQYQVLGNNKFQDEDYSLLKIRIFEGRKHQIRAHLSQVLGTPILFDYKYGFKFNPQNRLLQEQIFGKEEGILLQATMLEFNNFPYKCNVIQSNKEQGEIINYNDKHNRIRSQLSIQFCKSLQFLNINY